MQRVAYSCIYLCIRSTAPEGVGRVRTGFVVNVAHLTLCLLAFLLLGLAEESTAVDVDLSFLPPAQVVEVGETVDIQLVATSAGLISQGVVALDAILLWDPSVLELQEIVSGGGFPWFVSDFLTDPGGLNDDLTDGDALYTALTAPGTPVLVPPDPGLVVATFRFLALQDTSETEISLGATLGEFARTQVLFLFAEDITGDTSSVATVTIGGSSPGFQRGDANNDGTLNIADAVWVLNYLFQDQPAPPCLDAGDANDDSGVDIGDAIYIISWQFSRGPEPPSPFMSCGPDPTMDTLDCALYSHCP